MGTYDIAGITAAATALETVAANILATLPHTAAITPPSADPTSVAAAAVIDVNSASTHNAIAAGVTETVAAAARLRAAAAQIGATEGENTTLLGGTATTAVAASAIGDLIDMVSALPTLTLPTVPTLPTFVPAIDPEPMAALLSAGPGTTSLLAHSTAWTRTAATLTQSSRTTAAAARSLQTSWASPEGSRAVAGLTKLSDWYQATGTHAGTLAQHSTAQADHYLSARSTHPDQPTIVSTKQRLASLTTQATTDATVLPALAVEHAKFQQLVTRGNATTTRYAAASDTDAPKRGAPAPPKITDSTTKKRKKKNGKNSKSELTATSGKDNTTTTANTQKSIAQEGVDRATKLFDKQQNDKLVSTALQIGTQVAAQSAQAAQSMMGSVTSGLSKVTGLNGNRNNTPLSTLTAPYTTTPLGNTPSGPGGGPGNLGTPLGDVPVGTPGVPGGDDLGTTPSAYNGTVTPAMAAETTPKPVVGTTPTTQNSTTIATGSMMHPPYMNGMGHGAGGGGTRERNHALMPDRKVFIDDTEFVEDHISAATTALELPPPITPLFTDDDDEFVQ